MMFYTYMHGYIQVCNVCKFVIHVCLYVCACTQKPEDNFRCHSSGTIHVFLRWNLSFSCSSPSRLGWLPMQESACLYSSKNVPQCIVLFYYYLFFTEKNSHNIVLITPFSFSSSSQNLPTSPPTQLYIYSLSVKNKPRNPPPTPPHTHQAKDQ